MHCPQQAGKVARPLVVRLSGLIGNQSSYLVKHRSHPILQLSDDQAVCVPDVHQVVILIVKNLHGL